MRGEPATFNRYVNQGFPTELVTLLTQAPLVRINRLSDEAEPWLASGWSMSSDGRAIGLELRRGIVWSDGVPFDGDDVAFSFRAAYDQKNGSIIGSALTNGDRPIAVRVDGPHHVTLEFPAPYAPGVRLLDSLPIYPRHALGAALDAGSFGKAWDLTQVPSTIPCLGPFTIDAYTPGQRVSLVRNPRYFRRDAHGVALPYLDRVTLEIVPDQNTELLRLTSGEADVLQSEVRPDDYRLVKAAADEGRVRLIEVGPGIDRYLLWFNLGPHAARDRPYLQADEFRQAVSLGVNRQAMANAIYLGAADPSGLPVPPSNHAWQPQGLAPPTFDPARAATLLDGLGLQDRDHDGVREDGSGHPVRFSVLVQSGLTAGEKGIEFVRDELARIGIGVDVVPLDFGSVLGRWRQGQYDAIYHHLTPTDTDPAGNLDWWLSSGSGHVWNPAQPRPATAWEAEIDAAMSRQAATLDVAERRRIFSDVQRIFLAHNPAIYFVVPHVYVATSRRVHPMTPAMAPPQVLWAADELSVDSPGR
jgi:peptide/nickel transport system substrate-binding protein